MPRCVRARLGLVGEQPCAIAATESEHENAQAAAEKRLVVARKRHANGLLPWDRAQPMLDIRNRVWRHCTLVPLPKDKPVNHATFPMVAPRGWRKVFGSAVFALTPLKQSGVKE